MRDSLDFKTKKDRNDFLIALTVIGLFFGFFYGMLSCDGQAGFPDGLQAAIAPVLPADADEDGIPDDTDKCPNLAGTLLNEGCPADTDGDGIYDENDKCPAIAGIEKNMGCPADGDRDGVPDDKDKCPNLTGIASNHGCPADEDGDGVYDVNDKCPDIAGLAENEGCPDVVLEKEERTLLLTAMQNVEFQTGSATLKPASTEVLQEITKLMKKYKNYKLDIDGFTDNTGEATKNQQLSNDRAKACYDYLLNSGINRNRISYKGFGPRKAIAPNNTPEGRRKNRRVEFNLHY